MRDFAGRNESFRGQPPSNRQFQSIEHCNPHGGTFKMYKKEDNPSILGYSLNTGVKYHLITCTWTWTWNMVSNSEQLERNHPTASRVATQFDSGVHRLCLSHTSNHTNKPVISKIKINENWRNLNIYMLTPQLPRQAHHFKLSLWYRTRSTFPRIMPPH